jgi:hypothetical protein
MSSKRGRRDFLIDGYFGIAATRRGSVILNFGGDVQESNRGSCAPSGCHLLLEEHFETEA